LSSPEIGQSAVLHGHDLRKQGFTVSQVVHDYGDVCQSVTELAIELRAPISADDFRLLNACLDDAIAVAVTEFAREGNQAATERETARGSERLGFLAHELRNLLNTAMLAFGVLKTGNVGVGGSTGTVLNRSLVFARDLIDHSLAEVRLTHSLGYGTYSFEVLDTSQLDPSAAFSMYTFDPLGSDQNFRELTVDVSRWGEPGNMNGQFVVQPETVTANVFRFTIPAGLVTHSFRWEPGRVSFSAVRGAGTPRNASVVAERLFTARVPTAGAESAYLTLLYDRGAARPPSKAVEVVVEKFAFLP